MPRTKYTPHKEDITIIKQFLGGKAWGSTCHLITYLDGSRCHLHCGIYLLVPCHWTEFEERSVEAKEAANRYNTEPGLILYGECSEYDWAKVNWWSHREKFVTYWEPVKNRLRLLNFLVRGLDGLEWWNPENWKIEGGQNEKIQSS